MLSRRGAWSRRSNGSCIGSESNVPPTIVRCDYSDGSNSDPRCVGIGERRPAFDPSLPKSRLGWAFSFAATAYNLTRLPKLSV